MDTHKAYEEIEGAAASDHAGASIVVLQDLVRRVGHLEERLGDLESVLLKYLPV